MTLVRPPSRTAELAGVGLFGLAVAIGLAVVRPFEVGPIGPDAAAPVIEWQRLLAGQRLEGYLSQTSKPLLTVVYGILEGLAGDWRPVSWAVIGAFALCVVLAALLARRVGGDAAAAFVAVGFLVSPVLLDDVVLAYGLPWAAATWLVAALAVTAGRPRYGVAGVALLLGTLVRPETLALTGAALGALLVFSAVALARRVRGPSRGSWLLALGLLAVPVLAAHDSALTGDPLFWLTTAQANSEGAGNVRDLVGMIRFVASHVRGMAPLLPLAALGGAALLLERRWAAVTVVTAATLGMAALFIVVGARGTVVTSRYLGPIDLGLVLTAALGVSVVARLARPWLGAPFRTGAVTAAGLALAAASAAVVAPSWITDRAALDRADVQRRLHDNAQRAFAAIRAELGAPIPWRDAGVPPGAAPVVLIPPRLRAQGVVDLDLPLWAAEKSFAGGLDPAAGRPSPGTILYHDALDDKANARWAPFEVAAPVTVGRLRLVPLLVDAPAGVWVLRIEAPAD